MQNNEYASDSGAASPGCRRLLAGVYQCEDWRIGVKEAAF
jgi:hypothetical protein